MNTKGKGPNTYIQTTLTYTSISPALPSHDEIVDDIQSTSANPHNVDYSTSDELEEFQELTINESYKPEPKPHPMGGTYAALEFIPYPGESLKKIEDKTTSKVVFKPSKGKESQKVEDETTSKVVFNPSKGKEPQKSEDKDEAKYMKIPEGMTLVKLYVAFITIIQALMGTKPLDPNFMEKQRPIGVEERIHRSTRLSEDVLKPYMDKLNSNKGKIKRYTRDENIPRIYHDPKLNENFCAFRLMGLNAGGKHTIVDRQDIPIVVLSDTLCDDKGYVKISIDGKLQRLHRIIMGLSTTDTRVVDHINGCKYDNRRSNLRILTASDNAKNSSKRRDATSKYYGVRKGNSTRDKEPRFSIFYGDIYLASFIDEISGALYYNTFLDVHLIPFAKRNLDLPSLSEYRYTKPIEGLKKTSKYKGVFFDSGYWYAQIQINYEVIQKGPFALEDKAKQCYDTVLAPMRKKYKEDNRMRNEVIEDESNEDITVIWVKECRKNTRVKVWFNTCFEELVLQYYWIMDKNGYVASSTGRLHLLLHRLVTEATAGYKVNHIDSDPCNNTLDNLQVCSVQHNVANRVNFKRKDGATPYQGVNPRNGKFATGIGFYSNYLYLGVYDDDKVASSIRDYAKRLIYRYSPLKQTYNNSGAVLTNAQKKHVEAKVASIDHLIPRYDSTQ